MSRNTTTGRLILFAALLLLPAAGATSAGLQGSYGSKEGCLYAKTGESSGADDFVLLTPKAVTGSTFACEVGNVAPAANGTFRLTAKCEAEGEDSASEQVITVTPAGKDRYVIAFDDGTRLGPVPRCR